MSTSEERDVSDDENCPDCGSRMDFTCGLDGEGGGLLCWDCWDAQKARVRTINSIRQLITDLDTGRANGTIYTYGQIQRRLEVIIAEGIV